MTSSDVIVEKHIETPDFQHIPPSESKFGPERSSSAAEGSRLRVSVQPSLSIRDEDWTSMYDTYIFMDYLDGQTLDKAWGQRVDRKKSSILAEIGDSLIQVRAIPAAGYIGSLNHGPVTDCILGRYPLQGPFTSEPDFHTTLVDAFCKKHKGDLRSYMMGMISSQTHRIVFTPADLRPANILVKNGRLVGIINWEMAGWDPEYWEFAKAFYTWRWQNE